MALESKNLSIQVCTILDKSVDKKQNLSNLVKVLGTVQNGPLLVLYFSSIHSQSILLRILILGLQNSKKSQYSDDTELTRNFMILFVWRVKFVQIYNFFKMKEQKLPI